MTNRQIHIRCLPVAGIGNPYQYLMMEGLRQNPRLNVHHGEEGKFFALLKTVFKHRPDYIHIDWLHQYYLRRQHWMTFIQYPLFVLEIFLISFFTKTKLVWTLHNLKPHDQPYFGPYKWSRRFFAKRCSWIRVFHEGTAQKAAVLFDIEQTHFRVVPEGSYVGYYKDGISQKAARKTLSIPIDKQVFLFLGGIRPYKGIEDLIKIFKKYPERNLLIAGKTKDSTYKQKLLTLLEGQSNVKLYDQFIPNNDLQIYFRAADLVVLPFKKVENSGSAILAMGFQKAIIAPKMGVLVQRLEQQKALLYNNNIEEIISNNFLLEKGRICEFGILNHKALEKFTWKDFNSCFQKVEFKD